MSEKMDSLENALRALEVVFVAKLPGKLAEIETALCHFEQSPDNRDAIELLHRLLHTMAGSAGTFGFSELGENARELEKQIKPLLTSNLMDAAAIGRFSQDVRDYLVKAQLTAK